MKKKRVRTLAICVFRVKDKILVNEGYDKVKDQSFYRPLGGAIEFGETAQETLKREIKEEIGARVTELKYLGTLENIFVYNGKPHHEILLVYDGQFTDHTLYRKKLLRGARNQDGNYSFKALWKSLDKLRDSEVPVYPTGLMEMLLAH
jgi:8-oxo-dGTP pyrophosphatase MutT (NUDIX family)